MAWSGGSFSRTNGSNTGTTVWQQDQAGAVDIEADRHDTHDQDLADGINACLHKGGQNAMTANLDLGGYVFDNASGSFNFTNADAVDLSDTGNSLNIGSTSAGHLAFSPDIIQAKDDATTAGTLFLNQLGGQVDVGGNTASSDTIFTVNAATGQDSFIRLRENGVSQFQLYNDASLNRVRAVVQGSATDFYIEDGSSNVAAILDPNGGQTFNYNNATVLSTNSGGVTVQHPTSNTPIININDNTATRQAFIYSTTSALDITSEVASAVVRLSGDDAGSTSRLLFSGDPDGASGLYYTGVEELRSQDSDGSYNTSGAQTKDHGGTFRDVGFNVMVTSEQDTSATLSEIHTGRMIHKDAGGAVTYTLASGTSGTVPPVGAVINLTNEDTENVTISAAGTLRWFNGDGTPSTGNRTLAEGGWCTVYKYADTEWWITGNGLS